jgi:L-fuculose-phosphate aldolase
MVQKYKDERDEVAYFMSRLYNKDLTTCSGGNASMKVDDNTILITPTRLDKARLQGDQIVVMTLEGENLTPELKSTSETPIHLAVYKKRPDVKAIIHAHPLVATTYASSDKQICKNFTPETYIVLGDVIDTPFTLMWSDELGKVVSDATKEGDIVMMGNHGTLAVGKNLLEAFDKTEVLEAAAKMTLLSGVIGSKKELETEMLKKIDEVICK